MKNSLPFLIFSLLLFPALLRSQIFTNPDSVEVYLFDSVLVDVLANDYEIYYDSIYVFYASSHRVIDNRYILVDYRSHWRGKRGWLDPITYGVRQVNGPQSAHGVLHVNLINESYADLDINNLSARFYALGHHFWDFDGEPMFFAPKNSIKTPIFNTSFCIAGIESNTNQLHVSAERYRQIGEDFYSGPVSSFYDSLYDREWSRVWKLTTSDIHHHIANYTSPGYTPIRDIAEWPAHGDTLQGQLRQMAPFHDNNNNGIYEPMAGDYPLIRGDMTLFFVFNDVRRPNTESGGVPLGVEVHGMAYAFDRPDDSLLNNTIFLHYDIINRSQNQYNDTWIGLWFYPALGFYLDDFIGTHVEHGAIYVYNANPVDGTGQAWAYGAKPPVFGMQFLAGPYMDPDGLDNPKTDSLGNPLCDVSLNGANFGDGIVDNERFGLTRTLCHRKDNPLYILMQPTTPVQYYNSMRGIWRDSTRLFYGGNGHPNFGGYGPECAFIYPGDTDPCNFGTGGLPPNGPVLWTEHTAGNHPWGGNPGMASTGPFTFMPNERQELDVAFIFARDQVYDKSYDTLVDWMGRLKDLFENSPQMFDPVSFPHPQFVKDNVLIYPNPARNHIFISGLTDPKPATYQIFKITGQMVASGTVTNTESLTVAHLSQGLYIIRLQTGKEVISRKFIKE